MTYQVLWGVNTEEGPTVVDHFLRLVRRPGDALKETFEGL